MPSNVMTILVTGATGFIGRHLVQGLLAKGFRCRCLIRNPVTLADDELFQNPGIEVHKGDVTAPKTLADVGDGVDVVYHLAAAGHVAAVSEEAERAFFAMNVDGTKNLIEACAEAGVRRFIHFSSTAAMGITGEPLMDETTVCQPQTPYQKSKYASEQIALEMGRTHGLEVLVLRPCMVYGPGGQGEFLKFCRLIKKGVFPRVGLGENLTPIVHVDDDVVAAALGAMEGGRGGEVYLVASEKSYPMKELFCAIIHALRIRRAYLYVPVWAAYLAAWAIETMSTATGRPPVVARKNIISTAMDRTFDISKATQDLGYKPTAELGKGAEETIFYFREEGLV